METSTPIHTRREPALLLESFDSDSSSTTTQLGSADDTNMDEIAGGGVLPEILNMSKVDLTPVKEETVLQRIVNHTVACNEVVNYREFKFRPRSDSLPTLLQPSKMKILQTSRSADSLTFDGMMAGVDTTDWSGSSFDKSPEAEQAEEKEQEVVEVDSLQQSADQQEHFEDENLINEQSADVLINHKMKNSLYGIYGDKVLQDPLGGTPPGTPTRKRSTSPNVFSPLGKSPKMEVDIDEGKEVDGRFGRTHILDLPGGSRPRTQSLSVNIHDKGRKVSKARRRVNSIGGPFKQTLLTELLKKVERGRKDYGQ